MSMLTKDYNSNSYLPNQNNNVPYVSRQDLLFEKRKKEREQDIEKARLSIQSRQQQNYSQFKNQYGNNSSAQTYGNQMGHQHNQHEKHVTINDTASVATFDFNNNSQMLDKPFSPNQIDRDSDINERIDSQSDFSHQKNNQNYQTPNINNSRSQKNLKQINERTGRSVMDYSQTPQPNKNHFSTMKAMPNPLFGESEGDYKRRFINNEYKEFAKKSMERSRDRSTSKRMSRHIQKRQEAQSKSPTNDVNIYAQKQRYKYSYFNQVSQDQGSPIQKSSYDYAYASMPKPNQNSSHQSRHQANDGEQAGGYILKTDQRQILIQKELQKQEYSKALREQMEENQQRKQVTQQKRKQYDLEYEAVYNPFGKQGSGAPLRDDQGNIITVRSGHFTDNNQNQLNASYHSISPSRGNQYSINDDRQSVNTNMMQNQPNPRKVRIIDEPTENRNPFTDNYDLQMQIRERQKEEWKQNLQSQMHENQSRKYEQKMKRLVDDERDEERVHRQLRELNEETAKDKQSRASFKRNQSPFNNVPAITPRKSNNHLEILAGNHLVPQRENMRSQIDLRSQKDGMNNNLETSFDSHLKQPINDSFSLNPQRLKNERDQYENQIEQSLYNLKLEATNTQRDTNRALDRLNQMQSEIYLKQRQGELSSHEFFNDMMNQSKLMISSIKYQNINSSPFDQVLNTSQNLYSALPKPQLGHSYGSGTMKGLDSEFLIPKSQTMIGDIPKIEVNYAFKDTPPTTMLSNNNAGQSITDDLDDLIHRFQYQ